MAGYTIAQINEFLADGILSLDDAHVLLRARVLTNGPDARTSKRAQAWLDAHPLTVKAPRTSKRPPKATPAKAAKATRTAEQLAATALRQEAWALHNDVDITYAQACVKVGTTRAKDDA